MSIVGFVKAAHTLVLGLSNRQALAYSLFENRKEVLQGPGPIEMHQERLVSSEWILVSLVAV